MSPIHDSNASTDYRSSGDEPRGSVELGQVSQQQQQQQVQQCVSKLGFTIH